MMDFNKSAPENFYSKSTFEGKEILIKEKELMIFCPFHIKNLFLMNDRKKERRSGFFAKMSGKNVFFVFGAKIGQNREKIEFCFAIKKKVK